MGLIIHGIGFDWGLIRETIGHRQGFLLGLRDILFRGVGRSRRVWLRGGPVQRGGTVDDRRGGGLSLFLSLLFFGAKKGLEGGSEGFVRLAEVGGERGVRADGACFGQRRLAWTLD